MAKREARRGRRSFTAEFKAEAVRLCKVGDRTIKQVAADLDLTETALRDWVKRADVDAGKGPPGALVPEERDELRKNAVPLKADFALPSVAELKQGGQWRFEAALTVVTTPNAPSGRGYPTAELEKLCRAQQGVVILDEAYVDFAAENALKLALKFPHVLVARTFSKAYSLCFQRVGYFVGHAELIAALDKMRDSYNVNGLGQIAAEATLAELPFYRANFKRIIATRQWVSRELSALGFRVLPSQTNFILLEPSRFSAAEWLARLRAKKILVRWFSAPEVRDYLRITIGTQAEAAALVAAVRQILAVK